MPSSISLEIYVGGNIVDIKDIEVPGEHVKALTCACQLVQRLEFSEYEWNKRRNPPKIVAYKDENKMTAAEIR